MSEAHGVQFPATTGGRSTQRTSREVFSAAAEVVDRQLADEIRAEPDWRRRYPRHLRELTARAARSSAAASRIARAGLTRLHESFEFVTAGGTHRLDDAVEREPDERLGTRTVVGNGERTRELVVPYRGRDLRGDQIIEQARRWVERGIVEPAFADAIGRVVEHPEWLDLTGRTFALLGAGAEMGPTEHLLDWGAEVAAVDVPRPAVWERLGSLAAGRAGRLHVPTGPHGRDGADLLTGPAAVRAWLESLPGPLVLGNYAYADGGAFARLAMAADAVIEALQRHDPRLALAYLATPTDVFAVPPEAVAMARERQRGRRAASLARRLTAGRTFVPNYRRTVTAEDGRELGICDSLIIQQGPNYALAKRLQRWRAVVAHQDGRTSSVHVAPATLTRSVTSNRLLAAAYAGAGVFGIEAFEPATSRAVMSALLVHDLHHDTAAVPREGDPRGTELDMTMDAAHGGLWRVAWEPRSALPVAVALGARRLVALRP